MLTRFLIIGVGGSGGKTARFLHDGLRWRLKQVGWEGPLPVGWQFLQIDVPTQPDGNEASIPAQLPTVGGYYQSLSRANLRYRQIDEGLIPPDASRDLLESYLGWRPVPGEVTVPIERGAGQFRALGRIIALGGARQINSSIRSAIDRINAPDATAELNQLGKLLGTKESHEQPKPVALVISSIGGGSGAGMVSDVADILRATGESWCDESIGFLFTGDIFRDLPDLTKQGVQPNSLAAMSELMAGYWNGDTAGTDFAALSRSSIVVGDVQRRGIRYPFLIGRTNGEVAFGQQNEVYAAMGRSIAAFMTSAAAQDLMTAYLRAQWASNAQSIDDRTKLRPAVGGQTPFSSMGSASVSLGRDRFARYASQRLARATVEHLLRAHHVGRKVPEEVRPEDALMEATKDAWEWFNVSCGLDELTEANNQVIEAIRPADRGARLDALRLEARSNLGQFPDDKPPTWALLIGQEIAAREPGFVGADDAALQNAAMAWVNRVASLVEHATLQALGRPLVGAEVAIGLLDKARSHISEVIVELEDEARQLERKAARREEGVRSALGSLGNSNNVRATNASVEEALKRAITTLEWSSEARLRALACSLLRDLAENQIVPLRDSLASAVSALKIDEHPTTGPATSEVERWPEGEIVPEGLRGAINERLIEEPDEFPATYHTLLQATIGVTRSADAQRAAVRQVATATRPADGTSEIVVGNEPIEIIDLGEPMVLDVASAWWPKEFGRISPPSRAQYVVRLRASDILERADRWVQRRESAFGAYVNESLRSYLTKGDDEGEMSNRRARFMAAFTAALKLAPPLIGVSNGMLNIVHGEERPRLIYTFTEIPLDQTDLQDEVLKVMRVLNVFDGNQAQEDDAVGKIFGLGEERSIEMITFFQAPYQPVVFDSIMRPIAEEWERRKTTPDGAQRFWRWRRARPLPNFVPVGPDTRRAMVAGWFVGRLLGELTWSEASDFQPVQVMIPTLRRPVAFPTPLLGPVVVNEKDLLAAVLESMPLALVQCNSVGSLEPLAPYQRLIELGTEANVLPVLRDWLVRGITPGRTDPIERAYSLPAAPVARDAATAHQRQDAVLGYLDGRRAQYVDRLASMEVDQYTFFEVPRHYELKADYAHALQLLHRVVSAIDLDIIDDEND